MTEDMNKTLQAFKALSETGTKNYTLYGDVLIVEEVTAELPKTKSGLVMATGREKQIDGLELNKPVFVRVLAVGAGYYDEETGEDVPPEVQVGDIVLVGPMSVKWFSYFGNLISTATSRLGLTRESEIQMRFKGQEGYDKAFEILNSSLLPAA